MADPVLALWLPCLIFAHVFAGIWLLRAFLLTQTSSSAHKLEDVKTSHSSRHLPKDAVDPLGPKDVAVTGTSQQFQAAAAVDHFEAQGRSDDFRGADASSNESHTTLHLCPLSVTLEWQGIGCSYAVHGSTKVVLQDVWGKAHPGQMQALMGPSGAGKSTLMDILAMRKSVGNLAGEILVNGQPVPASFIKHTSYVPQEDTFTPTMTCHETLTFHAGVMLGGHQWRCHKRRAERVEEVLAAMGLRHLNDTLVGGVLPGGLNLRGLSGGERRRLSIAAGILGAPSVLFLDEPTSGLDSFAALSVMGHLQHVAQATHQTVIATIHQPRSAIWEMFDMVSLLASGRLMYHGEPAGMIPWFQSLGYTYTKGSEPDWVLDLVATGFEKDAQLFGHTMRTTDDVEEAADAFKDRHSKDIDSSSDHTPTFSDSKSTADGGKGQGKLAQQFKGSFNSPAELLAVKVGMVTSTAKSIKGSLREFQSSMSYPTGWWRQFTALLSREFKSMTRNPFDVAARILTFTYMGLMFGLMAYKISPTGLDHFNTANNMLFTAMLIMLLVPYVGISLYTADKTMYIADASARRYRTSAYYVAKVLATVPIHILNVVIFSGIYYGMGGLRAGGAAFGKFTCIIGLMQLIATQVLHLCAVVAPNHDITFVLSVTWTAIQLLCSSYYISFTVVWMQWITQLRYISASYFAIEALVQNEFRGTTMNCEEGLGAGLVDPLTAGLTNASPLQLAVLNQLKQPQPRCTFNQDALLAPLGFTRSFTQSVGILLAYWGVVHVLTYLGLLLVARKERR